MWWLSTRWHHKIVRQSPANLAKTPRLPIERLRAITALEKETRGEKFKFSQRFITKLSMLFNMSLVSTCWITVHSHWLLLNFQFSAYGSISRFIHRLYPPLRCSKAANRTNRFKSTNVTAIVLELHNVERSLHLSGFKRSLEILFQRLSPGSQMPHIALNSRNASRLKIFKVYLNRTSNSGEFSSWDHRNPHRGICWLKSVIS